MNYGLSNPIHIISFALLPATFARLYCVSLLCSMLITLFHSWDGVWISFTLFMTYLARNIGLFMVSVILLDLNSLSCYCETLLLDGTLPSHVLFLLFQLFELILSNIALSSLVCTSAELLILIIVMDGALNYLNLHRIS